MSEKFWSVWCEDGTVPNKRHMTKDSAIANASRLAQEKNKRYFLLEAVGVAIPLKSPVEYTDIK